MHCSKGREIYEAFTFEPGDKMKLVSILHKFSEYCKPRKNITILCHKFFTYRKLQGQNFYDFVTKLSMLAKFEDLNLPPMLVRFLKRN